MSILMVKTMAGADLEDMHHVIHIQTILKMTNDTMTTDNVSIMTPLTEIQEETMSTASSLYMALLNLLDV